MLFNSYVFLFVLLPITIIGYYFIGKSKYPRLGIFWLIASSLVFYGWYNPLYLVILVGSITINYTSGIQLSKGTELSRKKQILAIGLIFNVLLLGFFKYTNFFINTTNNLFKSDFHFVTIILPIAISFYTIQQIAYLVDIYRGEPRDHDFWEYCLFVLFFPKLLSGPIVRIKQMIPFLHKDYFPVVNSANLSVGLAAFVLGLFKKIVIADNVGSYATTIFNIAASGNGISFFNSWTGSLAYSMQIYFDFSGYCDMAIGLGLMLGIRLPLNFYSPYKSKSVIEFWRRWHMTLSSFIRDYIYIPLGGNRQGFPRQMLNLFIAMAIAGLWHGAGWTFVIWGCLHGLYLVINHSWRHFHKSKSNNPGRLSIVVSIMVTFIVVTIAWVFFRADSLSSALTMLKGMAGINGFHLPAGLLPSGLIGELLQKAGIVFDGLQGFSRLAAWNILLSFGGLFACWFLPNVQEYLSLYQPSLDSFKENPPKGILSTLRWQPNLLTLITLSCLALFSVIALTHVNQFVYSQF
jgi:alginate O-acetyltransferase complex protein AlgI